MAEQTDAHTEAAITVNLPAYNNVNVQVWFTQLTAIFNAKRISSQTSRYAYVVEKLPAEVAIDASDLLDEMPSDKPYDTLKEAILYKTGQSEEQRLRDLFNNLSLGQSKPSQLLRKMRVLLGSNTMSDTVLRQLWLDKLHVNTIQILASLPEEIELQKLADKIADNKPARPVYAATQRQPVASVVDADDMRKLSDRLAQLSIQVQDIQKSMQQQKCNFTNRTPPESRRRRHRSLSQNRENYQDNVCGIMLTLATRHINAVNLADLARIYLADDRHSKRETTFPAASEDGVRYREKNINRLFYVKDANSGYLFLVDTGAQTFFFSQDEEFITRNPEKKNIEIVSPLVKPETNVAESKLELIYKINDDPSWYMCILLGFQHYLTAFGSNLIVPIVAANSAFCMNGDSVGIGQKGPASPRSRLQCDCHRSLNAAPSCRPRRPRVPHAWLGKLPTGLRCDQGSRTVENERTGCSNHLSISGLIINVFITTLDRIRARQSRDAAATATARAAETPLRRSVRNARNAATTDRSKAAETFDRRCARQSWDAAATARPRESETKLKRTTRNARNAAATFAARNT
ncbi:unnamed protein product [Acanthosepion pharaonis]|uniref:DUF7041 domain-containing protein n=1 Tax=Acanthosepion pharaonis TaxID=158019 RepID=A0A812E2U5_ACAPH|nr:unnamed protein product [Sepia pharaonis]